MPAIEGNYLFMVTTDDELACLNRQTGDVVWIKPLGPHLKEGDEMILWSGPVIAGGHAIVTGSNGDILFFSPDGELSHTLNDKAGIPVSPIVVDGTLVTINHNAELAAYR
jgi:outer membrane protein assembly factor BamB